MYIRNCVQKKKTGRSRRKRIKGKGDTKEQYKKVTKLRPKMLCTCFQYIHSSIWHTNIYWKPPKGLQLWQLPLLYLSLERPRCKYPINHFIWLLFDESSLSARHTVCTLTHSIFHIALILISTEFFLVQVICSKRLTRGKTLLWFEIISQTRTDSSFEHRTLACPLLPLGG